MTNAKVTTGVTRPPLPVSTPQIDGVTATDIFVREVRVERSLNLHDEATVTVLSSRKEMESWIDKPIYFKFGTNPNYGHFHGYIRKVTKPQKFQENVLVTITAIGYSSLSRASKRRVFTGVTSDSILRKVAEETSMRVFMSPHWFTHKRVAQSGQTNWEFMVQTAKLASHFISAVDGVLWATNPIIELEKLRAFRSFSKATQLLDNQELLDFVPSDETKITKDLLYPEFSFFTSTGQLQAATWNPDKVPQYQVIDALEGVQSYSPDVEEHQKSPVSNYVYNSEYARLLKEALTLDVEVNQSAVARVRGTAAMVPGTVCNFDTGLRNANKDRLDGIWYVSAVSHEINEALFQTNLYLVRDKYRAMSSGTYEWFYQTKKPTMALRDGKWESTWRPQ
jgi:hypothetical protein